MALNTRGPGFCKPEIVRADRFPTGPHRPIRRERIPVRRALGGRKELGAILSEDTEGGRS